jgi:iron complex transport system substrate-binding protein
MFGSWHKPLIGAAAMIASLGVAQADTLRLISLGGNVTEIIYALGGDQWLVGTDQSSLYPLAAQDLPSVGYYRRLPAEGVASLRPTLVIASENAGPPRSIDQLRALGIPFMTVSDQPTQASLRRRVTDIARAIGRSSEAPAILDKFDQSLAQARGHFSSNMRAMTVVMRSGQLLGAGGGSAADAILKLAGLTNVLSSQAGYQPLSAEVVSALAPDVIVITSSSVESMGGIQNVKASAILKHTPAVADERLIVLDDLLAQGFSLRLPEAISQIRHGIDSAKPYRPHAQTH